MGKHHYIKPESKEIRGICVICQTNPQKKVGSTNKYMAMCSGCNHRLYASETTKQKVRDRANLRNRPYHPHKKDKCERCGFIPEHPCQLDVDHIDGNHQNNDPKNWQTLCSNCHRLKTWQESVSSPALE